MFINHFDCLRFSFVTHVQHCLFMAFSRVQPDATSLPLVAELARYIYIYIYVHCVPSSKVDKFIHELN